MYSVLFPQGKIRQRIQERKKNLFSDYSRSASKGLLTQLSPDRSAAHFCPGGQSALIETLRVSARVGGLPKKDCSVEHGKVE